MLRPAAWLGFALAALSQDSRAPGPLAGIDGIAGFSSVSKVVFADEGSAPHRLEAVYLFPDRARWRLLVIGGRSSERMLVYRSGERAHQLLPGKTQSSEFLADDLGKTVLQMELRHAAMTWPHGFTWEGRGEGRVATISTRTGNGRALGTLEATLGDDGRPSRIQAVDHLGNEVESLTIDGWQEFRKRWWPRTIHLSQHGRAVWTETVEEVRTRVYFVDLFFMPPDRRAALSASLESGHSVLSLDLQGITFRVRELEPACSWAQALAEARAWIDAMTTEGELQLDRVPTVELDDQGRPRRLILRLAQRSDSPPEGWTTVGDRPGLALVLDDLEDLDAELLVALAAAAPEGTRLGNPYCRILERQGGQEIQVYLPFEGL